MLLHSYIYLPTLLFHVEYLTSNLIQNKAMELQMQLSLSLHLREKIERERERHQLGQSTDEAR